MKSNKNAERTGAQSVPVALSAEREKMLTFCGVRVMDDFFASKRRSMQPGRIALQSVELCPDFIYYEGGNV